jgi:hypothetical protein
MEEIGHRGAPNVMICLFLTQQTARRDAKVVPFVGFFVHLLRFAYPRMVFRPKTTIPQHIINVLGYGAQEKTRTSTTLRPLAPEASASTNSATWA